MIERRDQLLDTDFRNWYRFACQLEVVAQWLCRFIKIFFVRAIGGKSLTTTQQRDFNWRNGPRDVLNIREKRQCQRGPVNCSTRARPLKASVHEALLRFPSYRVTAAFRRASISPLPVCPLQSPSKRQTTNERYIFGRLRQRSFSVWRN